ncbi:MAG: hypothetical protein K6E54_05585, partial [Bacteroidaceae bacterium]|nr:hypothetical protein [Bacteroidaceae bacterium]
MSIIKKIWRLRNFFLHLPTNIYFNFHYLPFKQAIKFPIIINKMTIENAKGRVIIDCPNIKTGMIHLGFKEVSVYPNTGLTWDNSGATVIFKGHAIIGNDSYISVAHNSTLEFGDDFVATAATKIISYRGIKIGQSCRFGWGVNILDTNFHPLYDMEKKQFKRASGKIEIGDYNWFSTGCRIMHSVVTPERCIFGMNTIVTRNCEKESYCLMGGNP